ncbi:SGNH/GDSL hydrolase family protein [Roseateles violae]|uniref:SGNH/GDSL hydrolase family protein n=1 Tax=Roseateles violae TaxID=3058042 RepID=A0ABT8DMM2_9BURK|nr:SGNH/GDSL hydrolase family protein [Pelomonas sp. PFR6]MDN3919644.1 SGNH/GDSL hydrolase family protein [Pelomonas sp. PFR6]
MTPIFMSVLRRAAPLILGLAALAMTPAQAYSQLYVFGDSLSDVGNDLLVTGGAVPNTTYYSGGGISGRFSNGLNYADHLATGLGLAPLLPSVQGGTAYAFGGARMDSVTAGLPPTALSFNQQIAAYGSNHALADPDALYVLWIGANNLRDGLTAAAQGNPGAVGTAITTVLGGLGSAIQNLAGRGASHFLIPNMPDLSLTPAVRAFNNATISAGAHNASIAFNNALGGVLMQAQAAGLDIRSFDVFALQTATTANPAAYGYSNVGSACYSGDVDGSALGGAPLTLCANPQQYLYFDYIHPTAALHAQLGAAALMAATAAVPEPASWLLMALGLAWLISRRHAGRRQA